MPEMNEKELEAMEQRCEATKAARQQLEADNEKLDLELMDAKAQLAKIQEGKDDFEAKLNKVNVVYMLLCGAFTLKERIVIIVFF